MAKLDTAERNNLKSSSFALPSERRFPIEDKSHAKAALSMVGRAKGLTEEEKKVIIRKAHQKLMASKK